MTFRFGRLALYFVFLTCWPWSRSELHLDVYLFNKEQVATSSETDLLQSTTASLGNVSKIRCVVFCLSSASCQTALFSRELHVCYLTRLKSEGNPSPYLITSSGVTNNYIYFTKTKGEYFFFKVS